jgi:hypothetical protein
VEDNLFAKQLFVSERKIAASCTVGYLETFKFSTRQFTTVDENLCIYFVCLMTSVVSNFVKFGTKKKVGKVFFNIARVTKFDRGKRSRRECCGRKARIGTDCVLAGMWEPRTI